jgi:hypothetical protein
VQFAASVLAFDTHQANEGAIARYRIGDERHPSLRPTDSFAAIAQIGNVHLNQIALLPAI